MIFLLFLYMFVIFCLSKSGLDTPSLREYCWGESMKTPLALGVLKDPPNSTIIIFPKNGHLAVPLVWTTPYHSDGYIIVITCHYIYPIYYPIVSLLNPYIPSHPHSFYSCLLAKSRILSKRRTLSSSLVLLWSCLSSSSFCRISSQQARRTKHNMHPILGATRRGSQKWQWKSL